MKNPSPLRGEWKTRVLEFPIRSPELGVHSSEFEIRSPELGIFSPE